MINKKLEKLRREFLNSELSETSIDANPIEQFGNWFDDAVQLKLLDLNAMTLATVDEKNNPQARIVLLKQFDEKGFVFYTNYNSDKSSQLKKNPKAALVIYWAEMERQIRIVGKVEKTTLKESINYFKSRPIDSQIGAWASDQSHVVEIREIIELAFKEMKLKFKNKKIPLPPFWGGYRVVPETIEFWQGRKNRLHDRILYTRKNEKWIIQRLMP